MPEIAEAQALLAVLAETEEVKAAEAQRQRRLHLQTSYGQAMMWAKGFAAEASGRSPRAWAAFLSCSKPICRALSALEHGGMRAWRVIPQWGQAPPSFPCASTIGQRSRCTSLCAACLSRDDLAGRASVHGMDKRPHRPRRPRRLHRV